MSELPHSVGPARRDEQDWLGATEYHDADPWFQHLLESAPDALLLIDSQGKILLVNRQAEFVFGFSRDELIGKPVELLVPLALRETHVQQRDDYFAQPRVRPMHAAQGLHGLHKDGHEIPVEISLSPVRGPHGTVVACAVRDVTDRLRAEQLLKQRHDELAHVTRLATVGELATGLAHELNQPLYSISNYARGCLRRLSTGSLAPERLREVLEEIASEADRAAKIIRRLRRMVQKREPVRKPLSLSHAIHEACSLSNPDLKRHGATLVRHLDSKLPRVIADEIQIQQVMINLLRNAAEAMRDTPADERVIRVAAGSADAGFLRVDVTDAGCGIPEQDLEKVFDAFHTTRSSGMGMGLAISRSIVEVHGGRIWAANNTIRGATFSFTLPLAPEANHDA